jgi:hypothetical protein
MVAKLDGNVKLQKKFLEVLTSDEKRQELKAKVDELKKMLEPPQTGPTDGTPPATPAEEPAAEKPEKSKGGK